MEAEKDRLHEYFKEDIVKEPSTDFTKLVMERVEEMATTPFIIKPLISRKGWIYIVLSGMVLIFGSFLLELAAALQKIPAAFELPFNVKLPTINWEDFATSIKVASGVTALLIILTVADIIYRKMKNIV